MDDGTDAEKVDGSHQLRWGEYSALDGVAKIECLDGRGTEVTIKAAGLVPGGLYTIWVVEFDGPIDPAKRDIGKIEENLVGSAPLGANDGSENVFRARGGMGTIEAIDESEPYPLPPGNEKESPSCLLDADTGHTIALIGALHLDDATWGPVPFVPPGTTANQFAYLVRIEDSILRSVP